MIEGGPIRCPARAALACLVVLVLSAALAACGGEGPATAKSASGAGPELTEGSVQNRADLARQRPRPAAPNGRCQTQVGAFLGAMEVLRRNLVVGLSYEQYVAEMKTIRRAYEAIPTDRVALGCLQAAGTPGESGLNQYIAAGNAWTGCVETPGCESASIEAELQRHWRTASRELSKAQLGLRRLGNG
jgi:predicted small lipoprotein YifL